MGVPTENKATLANPEANQGNFPIGIFDSGILPSRILSHLDIDNVLFYYTGIVLDIPKPIVIDERIDPSVIPIPLETLKVSVMLDPLLGFSHICKILPSNWVPMKVFVSSIFRGDKKVWLVLYFLPISFSVSIPAYSNFRAIPLNACVKVYSFGQMEILFFLQAKDYNVQGLF